MKAAPRRPLERTVVSLRLALPQPVPGLLHNKVTAGMGNSEAYTRSGQFASQSVEHLRTVVALGRLETFVDAYIHTLDEPMEVRRGIV